MLRLTCDDVIFFTTSFEKSCHALYAHIVTLGCTAGKYNLLGISANEVSDVFPGLLHSLFRFPAIRMGPGVWASAQAGHERKHCVQYTGVDRSGSLHVEIYGPCAFVHDSCLFEDARSRAHHG